MKKRTFLGCRTYKQSPDINLEDLFDDIEDDLRINKKDKKFIPIEELGSNEFNPEIIFISNEEKELNKINESQSFIIKSPRQQIHSRYLSIEEEEHILELIPCNPGISIISQPSQLGIGKIRQLKKLHHGRR